MTSIQDIGWEEMILKMKAHGCGQTILQVRFYSFFFNSEVQKKFGSWVESEVVELFPCIRMMGYFR